MKQDPSTATALWVTAGVVSLAAIPLLVWLSPAPPDNDSGLTPCCGVPDIEITAEKIDEDVTLVMMGEKVIVMQRGKSVKTETRTKNPETQQPSKPAPMKWTLKYSCADVKYYQQHFTPKQLDLMRKAAGIAPPTAVQMQQIRACVAGKVT